MNKDNKQKSKTRAGNPTKKWEIPKIAIESVPGNSRGYTHKVSPTCLHKSKLNTEDTNGHTKAERGKPMRPQPYTRN